MSKRTKMMIVNKVMLVSLIVTMATGLLLRPFPGMWMGILHGVSGITLTISIGIHCLQHGAKRKEQDSHILQNSMNRKEAADVS